MRGIKLNQVDRAKVIVSQGWVGLFLLFLAAVLLVLAACAPRGPSPTPAPTPTPTPAPTTPAPAATPASQPEPTDEEIPPLLQAYLSGWKTNIQRRSISLSEIMPGGPGKDGIPAIDHPKFISPGEAEAWLDPLEPVISFEVKGDARAYPLQVLLWHEIVNDEVGGQPVAVTFCPLCNTALVFDRRLEGKLYDFGVSGFLRLSDLVMYDRQTESWWQQVPGEAIVGELTGKRLTLLPASVISWADFKKAHPQGQVLSRDTGFSRPYSRNPYTGYDRIDQPPFLFFGKLDERLPPMERIVAVSLSQTSVAFPFSLLREVRVINHQVAGQGLVVFYQGETLSPLDQANIHASQQVGAAVVFSPLIGGRHLTFDAAASGFTDRETGSTWNLSGQAVSGELAGKSLAPVVHWNSFWFAWAAFEPDTVIYKP